MSRGACGLALFATCAGFVACGGSSKSKGAPGTGSTGAAGSGGSGVAGFGGGAGNGASGALGGAASGGEAGMPSGGAGDVAGGTGGVAGSGAANGGGGAAGDVMGGAAGDGASDAGAWSGGAGGDCRDLCSAQAPACCIDELRCVERTPSCRIDVLSESIGVTYEYADLEEEIRGLSGEIDATIELARVEQAYADPAPSSRFEMALGPDASTGLAALEAMDLHPFRLSCDDQELFVGVLYMLEGAAAIRTPVLHVEATETGSLVLRLGAWQGAWALGAGGRGDEDELRARLDRPELRAEFCSRGVLGEIP